MFAMEKPRKGIKSGSQPVFDENFKIMVAREYLTGQLSYSQLARKYNLSGEHTPRYFVRWYQQWLQEHDLSGQQDIPLAVTSDEEKQPLEKQLFEANLKITALELLIRTAEEALGIDIGKKSGTKRSVK
jgi:transposase-like protein